MKGFIARCIECGRLLIYGQTCTCGNETNDQERRAKEARDDDA